MNLTNDMIELVIARIKAMPSSIKIHLGGNAPLSKDDLLKHVTKQDDFGKKFVEIQMQYLQQLKNGL